MVQYDIINTNINLIVIITKTLRMLKVSRARNLFVISMDNVKMDNIINITYIYKEVKK